MRTRDIMKPANFIAWLKTKPADETYDYRDYMQCCFAQYLQAHSYKNIAVGGDYADINYHTNRKVFFSKDFSDVLVGYPRTFGGVLERMKSVKKMEQKQ